MARKRSGNGPEMARKWPGNGPEMAQKWPRNRLQNPVAHPKADLLKTCSQITVYSARSDLILGIGMVQKLQFAGAGYLPGKIISRISRIQITLAKKILADFYANSFDGIVAKVSHFKSYLHSNWPHNYKKYMNFSLDMHD